MPSEFCVRLFRKALAAMFFSISSVAVADNAEVPGDTLREATVVAMRPSTEVSSAVPVQLLDSLALLRRGVVDIGDALRRMAGINLRDYGGAGGLKTVNVRSLGASHTVVCYDGLPVSDARHGQIDVSRFSLNHLAEMRLSVGDVDEILCPVRSLGAATLHLQTFGKSLPQDFQGDFTIRQGSFDLWNPSLQLSSRLSPTVAAGVKADFLYAQNDYPFTLKNGKLTTEEKRNNSRMQATTLETDVAHHSPKIGVLRSKIYYRNHHQRLPGQVILYAQEGTERLAEQNAFGQLDWTLLRTDWKWMAAAKWNWQESKYADVDAQYPGGRLVQNYWQREGYATAGMARLWRNWEAAVAADYIFQSLNSNLAKQNDATRQTYLMCLSVKYASRSFNITARAQGYFDQNECEGGAAAKNANRWLPSVAASWTLLNRSRAKAPLVVFARGFYKEMLRVPTFTEAYYSHLGSQRLTPELTKQLGAGLTLQTYPGTWWKQLSITVDGYYNRISNRITSLPYNLFVWQTVNLGKVEAAGCDVNVESAIWVASHHELFLAANYSWQYATDRTSPEERNYGKQLAYLPMHSGGASLAYENPWLNAVVNITGASERWSTLDHNPTTLMKRYVEVGCGVYRAFQLSDVRLQAKAEVRNLFNHQYEIIKRYPMPGRSYRLTLGVHF